MKGIMRVIFDDPLAIIMALLLILTIALIAFTDVFAFSEKLSRVLPSS